MGTTVPKVCPHAAAASEAAKTVFHQIDFSITIHSKNIRFLSFSTQFQAFGAAGPALTFNRRKFVPGGGNRTGRGAPGSSSLTPPAGCAPPPYYSALFLRRRTISPRNRTASTAQTMRIIELSIIFLLSGENNLPYTLFIIGSNCRMMRITTGPTVTTNNEGR